MDKLLKVLMAIGVVCALGLTVQFARADECANGVFTEQREALEKNGMKVVQLNQDQITRLVEKVGQPPTTTGDYDAYLVSNAQLGAVFIVQPPCTTDRLGPAEINIIYNILGIVNAAKGERVD